MIKSKVIIKKPTVKDKLLENFVYGYAYARDFKIEIDPRQSSREYLNTLIHEIIHCILPDLSERSVIKMATIISDEIWNRKYRRISK